MKASAVRMPQAIVILAGLAFACGSSLAAKPEWAGNDKRHQDEPPVQVAVGAYFSEKQRAAATEYYGRQQQSGRCPPGLAKQNNGCMPPGQAKNWAVGQALPTTVVLYPLPRELVVKIGLPPAGYRYVRVANDILLVAIGSQMVVDAIENLLGP